MMRMQGAMRRSGAHVAKRAWWWMPWWEWALLASVLVIAFFVLDAMLSPNRRKYEGSVGLTAAQVIERLGTPERRSRAHEFNCVEKFLCHPESVRGDVFFFQEGLTGYYIFFDRSGRAIRVDHVVRD